MAKKDRETALVPPVVAYKTFKNFLRTLAPSTPSAIDRSIMRSMPGGVQTQMLGALRFLNLIDGNGVPQDKLTRLVKSETPEYQKTLQEVLTASYPFMKSGFDLKTATDALLAKQFEPLAAGDTIRKCITFFIPAAIDAGMEISPYIKKPGKRGPSAPKPRKQRVSSGGKQNQQEDQHDHDMQPPPLTWHQLLLSKFPSFDPNWPDEVKAKWFESFQNLMKQGEE
ncbi:MAG TPA: hypothetical protein VGH91_08635 [Gammaproteobacteria bacterium]